MGESKATPIDAAGQVIVLAFDLADAAIADSPRLVLTALASPQVQESIKKTLLDFAKTRSTAQTPSVSDAEARKLLEALGSGIKDGAGDAVFKAIKKTPQFARLETSVDEFKKAFESSTLGLWVDKNRNVLYVVGAALVVGTVSVLYLTKTGGTAVDTIVAPLKAKQFTILQVGTLTLKAALLDLKPDARIVSGRVAVVKDWQRVTVEGSIGVLSKDLEIQQLDARVVVKSGPFSVAVSGSGKPASQQVNLGLGVAYDGKIEGGSFSVNLGAMYESQTKGAATSVEYRGMLTLEIRL
jgi:hypothetical protein